MTKVDLETLMQSGAIALSSSQKSVSFPIVERIYKKMVKGISIRNGISVSKEFVIVDGHHRYLASLFANIDLPTTLVPLSLAKEIVDWKSVTIHETDWDSQATVNIHNALDAKYSGLTIDHLLELIA